jgi:hypothetical protein
MRITALGAVLIAVAIISAVLIIRHLNHKNHVEPEKTTS